jgi:hypothetical protein
VDLSQPVSGSARTSAPSPAGAPMPWPNGPHSRTGARSLPPCRSSSRPSGNRIFSNRDYALSQVILTFSDAAGFRWIRMPDGAISQQSRPTPLESVEAALKPDLPTRYERL